jgi:hypothetical protein
VTNTNVTTSTIINPFIGNLGNPASRTGTVQRVSGQGLQVSGSFDEFSMNRGSIQFNGSSQYLTIPNNAALQLGTGDFTVECWVYFNLLPASSSGFISKWASNVGWELYYSGSSASTNPNKFSFYSNTGQLVWSTTSAVLNTWYHVAVTRASGTVRIFINGVQENSVSGNVTNFNETTAITIGAENSGTGLFMNGYITNARIIKGVAVYTTNFTVPTQPFSSTDIYSTQTSILLNTVAYRPLNTVDSSLNNFTVTPTASPLPSELNPFQ